MKRLNPNTNKPFKKGDVREDGLIFYQYRMVVKPWSAPYFVEYWLKPELFFHHNHGRRSGEYRLIPEIAAIMLMGAKKRCAGSASREKQGRKATNGNVTSDKEWIIERIEAGFCEATGDALTTASKKPNSPSLDRIDPKNPDYTPENCRITTWQFNNMKGAYTDEEFIRVAEALKRVKRKQSAPVPTPGARAGKDNDQHRTTLRPGIG